MPSPNSTTRKAPVQRPSTPAEIAAAREDSPVPDSNDADLRAEANETEVVYTITETRRRPGGTLHMPKMGEFQLGELRQLAKAQQAEDLDAMLAVFETIMSPEDVELMNTLKLSEFLGLMETVGDAEGVTPGES